jgi:hypothetical protein
MKKQKNNKIRGKIKRIKEDWKKKTMEVSNNEAW